MREVKLEEPSRLPKREQLMRKETFGRLSCDGGWHTDSRAKGTLAAAPFRFGLKRVRS